MLPEIRQSPENRHPCINSELCIYGQFAKYVHSTWLVWLLWAIAFSTTAMSIIMSVCRHVTIVYASNGHVTPTIASNFVPEHLNRIKIKQKQFKSLMYYIFTPQFSNFLWDWILSNKIFNEIMQMWCDLRKPVTCRTEWNCKMKEINNIILMFFFVFDNL